jgi:hypothetical protein
MVLICCMLPAALPACDVPVFRYALERWPAATYTLTAFSGGSLGTDETGVIESCGKLYSDEALLANVSFEVNTASTDKENRLSLSFPLDRNRQRQIWTGPLTKSNISRVAESPAREKIAQQLLDGRVAVWVLLQCGDRDRDQAAEKLLKSELKKLEKTLTLPEAVSNEAVSHLPELEISFSTVTVSRDDPNESVLVNMLASTEPDLGDYADQPMAFPVFGRGRVLYALVGDGISSVNIHEASAFLAGPCACEIKDLTPGMDLLISADWQSVLEHSWVNAVDPLPLSGLGSMAARDEQAEGAQRSGISAPLLAMLAALSAILVVIVFVSIRIVRSGRGK